MISYEFNKKKIIKVILKKNTGQTDAYGSYWYNKLNDNGGGNQVVTFPTEKIAQHQLSRSFSK